MKYCRHCGAELQDQDLFCPKCGTKQIVAEEEPNIDPKPIPESTPVAPPPVEPAKSESRWNRGRGVNLSAKESTIITAAYAVFYIVYAILSPLLPASMYITRIFFIPLFGAHLAVMIVRMVKSINRKLHFLTVLHICFTAVAGAMLIGAIILLAMASNA